jgi:hypothetical protein
MKKLLILAILFSLNGFAQKYELGKVTIDELQEKVFPKDTSAVAAILFNVGETKIEYNQNSFFTIFTTVKTKIKIYKKEGYEWANKAVKYYIGGSTKEKLSFNNVFTYNLIDGKIVKTKLSSSGEFDEKINKFWGRKKITLPNVKEGSIIEFEYTLTSKAFNSLDIWEFQQNIPVAYSEFKTSIPEYFIYKPLLRGYITPKINTTTNRKTVNVTNKENIQKSDNLHRTSYSNDQFNYTETKTIYTLTDIPALKDESYVNNIKNYIASVEHELTGTRFPNTEAENFSTDWENVTKSIYESDNFGLELNKTGYFEKDIDALISNTNSKIEKTALIFNHVKSTMNWNEFLGYSCDAGVRKAYQDKVGNAAEINLMLTAMLRYAGIDANPILISTRGNGISLTPSRTAFDYVITGIELENQVILLDATNKYALPNILPIRDLNWFGRIIRKSGSSASIDLMPKTNSIDAVMLMATINPEGEASGKVREQYFDYNAFVYRNSYNGITKDSYVERLEKRYPGIEITDYDVQNNNDLSKPIIESYSFTNNTVSEIIGDKMYISPLLFFTTKENPFKQETRQYPVDFVYPSQDKYNVSLTIPEGYTIETIPETKAMAMPESLGKFSYNISKNNNQIQLMYSFEINQAIISPDYYEALKNFFKELVNKQNEKIVLKKI